MSIEADCSPEKAQEYFDNISKQLKKKSKIYFSRTNKVFRTDKNLGFIVEDRNKEKSGLFNYRLMLKDNKKQSEQDEKFRLIKTKPVKMHLFNQLGEMAKNIKDCSSAQVSENCRLLVSFTKTKIQTTIVKWDNGSLQNIKNFYKEFDLAFELNEKYLLRRIHVE